MQGAAADTTEREFQMLGAMVDCAYAVGMAFGEAAKAEADIRHRIELSGAFERCFLAVRMGIRLRLALRGSPRLRPAEEREPAETERAERAETERPECDPDDRAEREREREYEPVSLQRFLATLGAVTADTRRLGDRLPDEVRAGVLPTLDDLLARAKAERARPASRPQAAAGPTVLNSAQAPAKARLLGSASAALSPPIALRRAGLARPPPRAPG